MTAKEEEKQMVSFMAVFMVVFLSARRLSPC
jgi:hypothetical protein